MPKIIIFDLDGTLTESKQPLTTEMAELLEKLLATTNIAIISGGAFPQFLKQIVARLPADANLARLYILPTSGAALYEYRSSDWNKVYEERLTESENQAIEAAMLEAIKETSVIDLTENSWGERIEHRGAQVTLSALGQQAPITLKKAWDPDRSKREALHASLSPKLPTFSVKMGGATSIDVTKNGIDKAYGLRKLCERLHLHESDALYVGDELRSGGNDEAVYKTAAKTKEVASPADTARFIESILTTS